MATTVTTDFLHSFDGKIGKVQQIAGAWQTISTKTDFNNFTTNATTKQNLAAGMFFYVSDEDQLYKAKVTGVGPFATWSLDSASFSGIDTSSFLTAADTSSFVLVSQTGSMSVATASYVDPTFLSASIAASGFGAGGDTLPSGTISSSQQITDLGFISSSHTDITALNLFTSSAQTSIDALNLATSSFLLVNQTSSFITNDQTSSFVLITQTSSMTVLSSSYSITASYVDPTFLSASIAASGFGAGGDSIPAGTVSSSVQTIAHLQGTGIVSASAGVPTGTISGSQQILDLGYINSNVTSSMTVLSSSYAISASYALNGVSSDGSITSDNWAISSEGIITLSATTETGSLGAGSIWFDGTNFYFNV